jgi:hypothetical protein
VARLLRPFKPLFPLMGRFYFFRHRMAHRQLTSRPCREIRGLTNPLSSLTAFGCFGIFGLLSVCNCFIASQGHMLTHNRLFCFTPFGQNNPAMIYELVLFCQMQRHMRTSAKLLYNFLFAFSGFSALVRLSHKPTRADDKSC